MSRVDSAKQKQAETDCGQPGDSKERKKTQPWDLCCIKWRCWLMTMNFLQSRCLVKKKKKVPKPCHLYVFSNPAVVTSTILFKLLLAFAGWPLTGKAFWMQKLCGLSVGLPRNLIHSKPNSWLASHWIYWPTEPGQIEWVNEKEVREAGFGPDLGHSFILLNLRISWGPHY